MPIQVGRRISNAVVQRSMREVGRIRAGTSVEVPGKTWRKPRRSDTLILTSFHQDLIVAAADMWGGTPEQWTPQGSNVPIWRVVTDAPQIPAILPQGNPLSTMFEMWTGGRCVRRCDGEWEEKTADRLVPCVCTASFGPKWYERDATNPPTTCKITGRLNVYLEGLGDMGFWRIDVHSFYAVTELSGIVDLVKARLGPESTIRVQLAIEQRSRGKLSYPVVAVRLVDHVAIAVLSGVEPKLMVEGLPDRRELTAGPHQPDEPTPDEFEQAMDKTDQQLRAAGIQPPARHGDSPPPDVSVNQPGPAGGPHPQSQTKPSTNSHLQSQTNQQDPQSLSIHQVWQDRFATATDTTQLRDMWKPAGDAGALDAPTRAAFMAAKKRLDDEATRAAAAAAEPAAAKEDWPPVAEPPTDAVPDHGEPVDGELEPDKAQVWGQVLAAAGQRGWTLQQTKTELEKITGYAFDAADGWAVQLFLDYLEGRVGL